MNRDKLREELAAYAHEAWANSIRHLFCTIMDCYLEPKVIVYDKETRKALHCDVVWSDGAQAYIDFCKEKMGTNYMLLKHKEKESDRKEADRMIAIMEGHWNQDEPEFESCPFCKENNGDVSNENGGYTAFCKSCMARGPAQFHTKKKAINAWNNAARLSEESCKECGPKDACEKCLAEKNVMTYLPGPGKPAMKICTSCIKKIEKKWLKGEGDVSSL